MLLTVVGFSERASILPISLMSISNILDITSMNLPVPAAHLSFMKNLVTFPLSSIEMAFASCPPISMIVLAVGKRK